MKNHWVITRPKRKLILVPDLLKIFSSVAEGQKWNHNREVQIKFEQALTDAQWKAQNVSASGSGGRTYAALLFMLGLWYEDDQGVQITNAGKEIIEGESPVTILTKQLLDFQYPSPYSLKRSVRISPEFRVQPYRFILNLLLESGLDHVSQDEIAYCLVPFAKSNADLKLCIELIHAFRDDPDAVINRALQESGATRDNLKNIGNTAVNQFEYTGFFIEEQDIRRLRLKPDMIPDIREIISGRRKGLISNPQDEPTYQKRYGSGIKVGKDYRDSVREPMLISPNERKVLTEFYVIASSEPVFVKDESIVYRLSQRTGASKTLVNKVLDTLPIEHGGDQFETAYVQLSIGGTQTAKDFERKTTRLLEVGFNLNAEWVGNRARYPDIIVYFNRELKKHGIIDTKAYREYNLPLDHKNKMAYTYIRDLATITDNGITYELAFFNYVAGGFSSNIQRSFEEYTENNLTDVPGSYLTARNLLRLYHMHKNQPFSNEDFIEIFACGKEILPNEIRH